MKITVAIDSFKGCMTSAEAGEAAAKGIYLACPDADVAVYPIADGGEGTVQALTAVPNGKCRYISVTDPVGNKVTACYGIVDNTAVIEIASAAGLALVDKARRNPMHTTTYGVGEIIRDAIEIGCRDFIIGLGGSATNDCGIGMLQALGFVFLDENGNSVPYGAYGLMKIRTIECENAMSELRDCSFNIACDVTNPLCGPNGCSAVFAPQKGASESDIPVMDAAMADFAALTKQTYAFADETAAGAGAAGGLGYAFMTYLGGRMQSGIKLIMERIGLEQSIADSYLIITGEGRLDAQTVMGKVPSGVAEAAVRHGKPIFALAGCIGEGADACNRHGIDAFFPILRSPMSLSEAMDAETAKKNITATVHQIINLYLAAQKYRGKPSK